MAKRQFRLTTQETNQLLAAYQQCRDGPTRSRYQAVRLYGTGYAATEVMAITGCSRTSLMTWCRLYGQHGPNVLVDKRMGGNCAKLTREQIHDLAEHLVEYTPQQLFGASAASPGGQFWTVEDLACAVERRHGVIYRSRSSYLSLFDRCGFSYQRTERVFKPRREAQVAAFQEQLEKNC
jgi:transposase